MKRRWKISISLILTLFLTACGHKIADNLIAFSYSDDDQSSIVYEDTEYIFYGLPDKSDMTEQIGILNKDKVDKIFSYKDYSMEQFIIEYYESGEMDNPYLYRAANCDIIPEDVYILEDEEPSDIIYLVDDFFENNAEDGTVINYSVGDYEYDNYFEVYDSEDDYTYIALSDSDTITLEEIHDSLKGNIDISEMIVVGYY